MAVTASPYGLALLKLGQGTFNFDSITLKVALTTSSYTPNIDTHDFFDDVTNEITGTGYVAGGATVSNLVWAYDSANNRAKLTADPTTWATATFTCRYAVVYKSTGVASTSPLLGYVDFGADQSPVGIDFVITWSATLGLFRVTAV